VSSELTPVPRFPRVRLDELEAVQSLATQIWRVAYANLLSAAQIDYMLPRMYAPDVIRAELVRGIVWEWIEWEAAHVGYLAWEHQPSARRVHLHKLYLVPRLHGRGLGQAALQRVISHARSLGADGVTLHVNRHNETALKAYSRAGFRVFGEICTDIGSGFVMDDFQLQRELGPDPHLLPFSPPSED
jgi:ribosomal protein S18 acetylase RimI-like enzyme